MGKICAAIHKAVAMMLAGKMRRQLKIVWQPRGVGQ
jgi:hypothetical protein